ncbi:MAG TPA: peptide deformylase [Candidatus Limnocylindrales bacterium]|nr:peptide deformylase [Candidatus Limnocylindrales bacterium]
MDKKPLKLRYYGDPVLRKKTEPVASVGPEIRELIAGLFDCMYRERGIGLAAPQVGSTHRVFVVDVEAEGGERTKLAFVNPVIREFVGSVVGEEGCLSIPGIHADVRRHAHVVIEGLDERGEKVSVRADGLLSRALQHELDHLDGILFIDRVSAIRRKLLEPKLARMKFGGSERPAQSPSTSPSF